MLETQPVHTEPQPYFSRIAAFIAIFHACIYSLVAIGFDREMSVYPFYFDGFVVACWSLGSNGRATIIDFLRVFKGGK